MPSALRMRSMAMVFFPWLVLITCSCFSSSLNNTNYSSISSIRCHAEERAALLGFINSINIDYSDPLSIGMRTWKKESDCCEWNGVKCDPTSHHVVELNVEGSGLVGTPDSNSSLFHLHHLCILNLYGNDFRHSTISPMFGSSFPFLEELYLVDSNFSGEVPLEISKLSKLKSLHLTSYNNGQLTMKMSTFYGIISNLKE